MKIKVNIEIIEDPETESGKSEFIANKIKEAINNEIDNLKKFFNWREKIKEETENAKDEELENLLEELRKIL